MSSKKYIVLNTNIKRSVVVPKATVIREQSKRSDITKEVDVTWWGWFTFGKDPVEQGAFATLGQWLTVDGDKLTLCVERDGGTCFRAQIHIAKISSKGRVEWEAISDPDPYGYFC